MDTRAWGRAAGGGGVTSQGVALWGGCRGAPGEVGSRRPGQGCCPAWPLVSWGRCWVAAKARACHPCPGLCLVPAPARPCGGRSPGRASGPGPKPRREPPVGGGVGGGGSSHLYCLGSCGGAWLSGGGRTPLPPPTPPPRSAEWGSVARRRRGRTGAPWEPLAREGPGQAGHIAGPRVTEADVSDLVSSRPETSFLFLRGPILHPRCRCRCRREPGALPRPALRCPVLPAAAGARGSVPGPCVRAPAAVGVAAVPAHSTPCGPGWETCWCRPAAAGRPPPPLGR